MVALARILFLALGSATAAFAAPPAGLASALEHLRDQKSYSWEVINGDPGLVAFNRAAVHFDQVNRVVAAGQGVRARARLRETVNGHGLEERGQR